MTDIREKQPKRQVVDLTKDTYGTYTFEVDICVSVYSGIKNEDVYTRDNTFVFRAEGMRAAHGWAQSLSHTISLAHDVWRASVSRVAKA